MSLRRDAIAEGRSALVGLVDRDLAAAFSDRQLAAGTRPPPPLRVHVLETELAVTVDGERLPAPRGFPAKLLALLVAAEGSLTVDTAIKGLWPGADADVGRNRLHGVLLRLRRSLGLPAGGPVSCIDDMVRLEPTPQLEVDSWEFSATPPSPPPSRRQPGRRSPSTRGDVLAVQFAYDDTIEALPAGAPADVPASRRDAARRPAGRSRCRRACVDRTPGSRARPRRRRPLPGRGVDAGPPRPRHGGSSARGGDRLRPRRPRVGRCCVPPPGCVDVTRRWAGSVSETRRIPPR